VTTRPRKPKGAEAAPLPPATPTPAEERTELAELAELITKLVKADKRMFGRASTERVAQALLDQASPRQIEKVKAGAAGENLARMIRRLEREGR
jgi:hypothetical protein